MKLQSRDLNIRMRGEDVALLQRELRLLGFEFGDEEGRFGPETFRAVKEFQRRNHLPVTGSVTKKDALVINREVDALETQSYLVRGRVLNADGSAVVRSRIRVFNKRLRSEEDLDDSRADQQGQYEISYRIPVEPFSIIVRAFDQRDEEIGFSKIICRPEPVETVDIIVGGELLKASEFKQLDNALRPIMRAENTHPADLNVEDVQILTCAHELEAEHVAYYVASARLHRETDINWEAFYGLLRQGVPPQLEALVAQEPEILRRNLENSVNTNIIGEDINDLIPGIIDALQEQIVNLALKEPEPDRPTFKAYFNIAGVSSRHQTRILRDYLRHEGTITEFWKGLRENPDIENDEIDELQHTLKVGTFALNHLPLVGELMRLRKSGALGKELRDLAKLGKEEWHSLLSSEVDGKKIGAPLFFGLDDEEPIERYAEFLPKMVEAIFPTAVFAKFLSDADNDDFDFTPIKEFFEHHPEFDFSDGTVRAYIDNNPEALDGMSDRAATLNQLKTVQRLYSIAPAFDKSKVIMAMMTSGQDSAVKIRRMGLAHFIRTNAETFGSEAIARQVYDKASRRADMALFLLSQSSVFSPIALPHLKLQLLDDQLEEGGLPDLRDLFGSLDLCACKHCSSVYSPAAYLVDALHFLMNRRANSPARTALDVLFERRPDIGEVELNCHNTLTEMPYVDLVNEILETAVVLDSGTLSVVENNDDPEDVVFPFQTRAESAQIVAEPEHLNQAAYDRLTNEAVYPWSLPFDLWAEEARFYLEQLGAERHILMELFRREDNVPRPIDVAAEFLHLTPKEIAILTGTASETLDDMWGGSLNQLTGVANAAGVLRMSRLSYEEIVVLLDTPFVNRGSDMQIEFEGADCNLDTAEIPNLDDEPLSRMHRFIRLQRKLDWPVEELGYAMERLGIDDLDDEALLNIAQLKRLRYELHTPLDTMLSWWSLRLDTHERKGRRPFYEKIFLNPTVSRPVLEPEIFELNQDLTELQIATPPNIPESIGTHAIKIQTILGIDADDLERLVASELSNDTLNLGNLTRLYRATTLAKAMKLTVTELAAMQALTGINPFDTGNVQATVEFLDQIISLRESGVSIAVLDYLLRHQLVEEPGVMTDKDIGIALRQLARALVKINSENSFQTGQDPAGERTTEKLSLLFSTEIVGRTAALIDGNSNEESQADLEQLVNEHLTSFLDPADAIEKLVNLSTLVLASDRYDYVLEPLLAHVVRITSEDLVVASLTEMLGLSIDVTEKLVWELLKIPGNPTEPIVEAFLSSELLAAFADNTDEDFIPTVNILPGQFATFHRLAKVALMLNTLGINTDVDQVSTLIERGPQLGWLDIGALPLASETTDPALFVLWQETAGLFRAFLELAGGGLTVFDLLAKIEEADTSRIQYLEMVAELTGWKLHDIQFLTGPNANNLQFPDEFRSGLFIAKLKPIFTLINSLKVSAETAWSWRAPIVDHTLARTIKQALRARYDDEQQWFRVAKPIRDELREMQRSALVDYLVHALPDIDDSNGLYGHFLIDVEMDPCMMTSRLVQATNAVQLFIQRCLLNLEDVQLTPDDAKEWSWMKNYRVWEANRKVFLYPENWIEPELRDNKTPFFEELEGGLLQDEINQATVEREYLKYLKVLNEVAQLEIMGLYVEADVKNYILHVFGRTMNTPHIYFYRRWVNKRYWTPWERIDADIEGDHLVPVVWNRRLYIFWPMFLEKAVEETVSEGEQDSPLRYYEIRLVWSEYRENKWLPKQVSDVYSETTPKRGKIEDKKKFAFWTDFDSDKNLIVCFSSTRSVGQFRLTFSGNIDGVNFDSETNTWAPFEPLPNFSSYPTVPGTIQQFNSVQESSQHDSLELPSKLETISVVADFAQGPLVTELVTNMEPITVLGNTPGKFRITPVHSEKYFSSRNPFFYQDEKRNFFVVPRGTYSGGFDSRVDNDFAIEMKPIDGIPLELPDAITVSSLAIINSGRRSMSDTVSDSTFFDNVIHFDENNSAVTEIAPVRAISTILNVPAINFHNFLPKQWNATAFRFHNHYHPFVSILIEQLNKYGIDGLLKPNHEMEIKIGGLGGKIHRQSLLRVFFGEYSPNVKSVDNTVTTDTGVSLLINPSDQFDFSYSAAYSIYNWELFFHAPFMLAKRLTSNQRFAEAQRWFHYIFDPTYVPKDPEKEPWPDRVWQIKPFFQEGVGKTIKDTMMLLKSSGLSKEEREDRQELRYQIDEWRKNPFNPHTLARMRPIAYMQAVVMAYLDNLIAWADHLFSQDTRESVNEATQLYILAAEILGERPREIPAHEGTRKTINGEEVKTFNDIKGHLDEFSNVLVELETEVDDSDLSSGGGINSVLSASGFKLQGNINNGVGFVPGLSVVPGDDRPDEDGEHRDDPAPIPAILGPTLFFCIPKNDKLLGYWDTVADRLFKIRHCMNIEGVERQLSLFQPPIDPGLLVKAAAAGVDIGSVLSDLNAPSPHYRFQILAQKASELISEVKSLGGALLAALEKQDAEEMALLRASHEIQVLETIRQTKEKAIEEAEVNIEGLRESRKITNFHFRYYSSRPRTIAKEDFHLKKLEAAFAWQTSSQALELLAGTLSLIPQFDLGVSGISSPVFKVEAGGVQISSVVQIASRAMQLASSIESYRANKASIVGSHDRREHDWKFQADSAEKELRQIDYQIEASRIRAAIAEQDLHNHEKQIENSKEIEQYMQGKYTNQELYFWMLSQISSVYFQSYQLAYDLAKQAERAFQSELGFTDSHFIRFGYWDGLKKGLLSGEKLYHDLKRMEVAYLEQNRREFEITKHVSLLQLDPMALIKLRETGACEFSIPEPVFDIDNSGHYMRRIKTVSVSIPSIIGPYASISCTLSLLKSSIRKANTLLDGEHYGRDLENDDLRFEDHFGPIQSIVTSSGQSDSGLFEVNLKDERFLPFEGAGVISTWRIELPEVYRSFDYNTISDFLLHISYTARPTGGQLKEQAIAELEETLNSMVRASQEHEGLARLFSIKHEFNSEWHRFLPVANDSDEQTMTLGLTRDRFPILFQRFGITISVSRITLLLKIQPGFAANHNAGTLRLTSAIGDSAPPASDAGSVILEFSDWNGLLLANIAGASLADLPGNLTINAALGSGAQIDSKAIEDIFLVCQYTVEQNE